MLACPRNSCTSRMLVLDSSRCVAHECRLYLRRYSRHYVARSTTSAQKQSPSSFLGNLAVRGVVLWWAERHPLEACQRPWCVADGGRCHVVVGERGICGPLRVGACWANTK